MKQAKTIILNVVVFVGLLGILEVAARALFPEHNNAYYSESITRGNPIYKSSNWGHRVSKEQVDFSFPPKEKKSRVLFIGDSVTFGYGVGYGQTYHALANEKLTALSCGPEVFGVGRYHTNLEQLMNSEFRSLILHDSAPDFVVYQFNVNDLDPPGNPKKLPGDRLTLREKFEKIRLTYLNRSTFLKTVQAESMKVYLRSKHRDSTDSIRYSGKTDPNLYARQWGHFESSLLDVRETLAKEGIRFAILLVPEAIKISALEIDNEFHVNTSGISIWPGERVKEMAARLSIPVIDSASYLKAYREIHPSTKLYFPNDANHPNYKGHQVIADAVISELPVISGCLQ